MKKTSLAVDAYINRSERFARPLLRKIRVLFHRADPRITETMKWGLPHFEYQGILGSMAAFKEHVSIGFWKGGLMKDERGLFESAGNRKMTMLRMRSVADLPQDQLLVRYIRQAVDLNERGVRIPSRRKGMVRVIVPVVLRDALKRDRKAAGVFASLTKSHQREYIEWLTEAKRAETRQRRLATAVQWLREGKSKNWKYER